MEKLFLLIIVTLAWIPAKVQAQVLLPPLPPLDTPAYQDQPQNPKLEFSLMGGWTRNPDPTYWNNTADLDFNIGGQFIIFENPHWSFGASALYNVLPSHVYNSYSYDASGTYTSNDTFYSSELELVAFTKWFPFGRNKFSVYLLGGAGVAVNYGKGHSVFVSTNPSEASYDEWYYNPPQTFPMLQIGIGADLSIGNSWSLFAEEKGDMSIGHGAVGILEPVDAGVDLHL